MALEGSLSEFSVLETLQLIGMQKKTGRLDVSSGRQRHSLHFRDGLLVSCEATRGNDRDPFLAALVGLGQLGSEEDRRYRATITATPDLWSRIVDSVPLEPETLEETRLLAMQATLDPVLLWNRGHFQFDSDCPVPSDFPGWNTEQMLLESMRRLDEAADLKAGEFPLGAVPFAMPGLGFEPERAADDVLAASLERAFLARVDGKRTLGDLIKNLGVAEYDILNAARVLRLRRRIRLETKGRSADGTQLLLEQPLRLRHPLLYLGAVLLVCALSATGLLVHRATVRAAEMQLAIPARDLFERERDLKTALEIYRLRHDRYPSRLSDLQSAGLWRDPAEREEGRYRVASAGLTYEWTPLPEDAALSR